jgi:hypothetical protein
LGDQGSDFGISLGWLGERDKRLELCSDRTQRSSKLLVSIPPQLNLYGASFTSAEITLNAKRICSLKTDDARSDLSVRGGCSEYGAAARGAGGAERTGRPSEYANRSKEGGGGDVYEKSLEMRLLRDPSVLGGGRVALLGAPQSVGTNK